jgi:hypothetical protein
MLENEMRPFRLRVVAAIVLAFLLLGSLGSVANADELWTGSFALAPSNDQPVPSAFPEDPWPGMSLPPTSFPEDPWPGLSIAPVNSFPEDPWPGLAGTVNSFPEDPWPGLSN